MSKNTVAVIGIVGLVVLGIVAALMGINGEFRTIVVSGITLVMGYVFGMKGEAGAKKVVPAVLLCLVLAGCTSTGAPAIDVEACVFSQDYGKICATYAGGRWKFSADVELPPDLVSSETLEELVGKLRK